MRVETTDHEIELLNAWRSGDAHAGDLLMRAYYPRIRRFFRLRAGEAAEDLTQKTLLACTVGRDRVQASTFRAYVFGAAHKLLLRHRRSSQLEVSRASLKGPPPPSIISPSHMASLRQEQWLLLRGLEQLNLDQQLVLALYYVEGLCSREIGEVLEIPLSTITTRLSRARIALRAELDTLKAPKGVQGKLVADLEGWVRSLGDLADVIPPTTIR